jgi:hypothetical protein
MRNWSCWGEPAHGFVSLARPPRELGIRPAASIVGLSEIWPTARAREFVPKLPPWGGWRPTSTRPIVQSPYLKYGISLIQPLVTIA